MKFLRILAVIGFLVAVPLLIVLSNVRWVALSQATYENGFTRCGAARATGMSAEQLRLAGQQIIAYFDTGQPVTLLVQKEWGTELLFNQRERGHLVDVRALFQLAFRVQEGAAVFIVLFALLSSLWYRPSHLEKLARYALAGGVLTIAVVAIVGALAAVDFDSLFLRFHLASFSNDLWLLDPRTDYMIRLFPQGFWFEVALRIVLWSMAESLALSGLTLGFLRWRARGKLAAG